ncbi:MAG: helix-turn-helix domain-containing protein [Chloroflexi bacterium]|nr:helix-turn-helix domain-containing protein [Chloroflexota bacterium]
MRGPQPISLHVTTCQRGILEQIVRRTSSPQAEAARAKIVLAAADGFNNQHIADRLGLQPPTARKWRGRWAQADDRLAAIESDGDEAALRDAIHELLSDAPRPGTPATFIPEQICQIVAVGCESPAESGRPVTHWTPTELADEAVKRGIVRCISPRSVGRFLKRGRSQAASVSLLAKQPTRG